MARCWPRRSTSGRIPGRRHRAAGGWRTRGRWRRRRCTGNPRRRAAPRGPPCRPALDTSPRRRDRPRLRPWDHNLPGNGATRCIEVRSGRSPPAGRIAPAGRWCRWATAPPGRRRTVRHWLAPRSSLGPRSRLPRSERATRTMVCARQPPRGVRRDSANPVVGVTWFPLPAPAVAARRLDRAPDRRGHQWRRPPRHRHRQDPRRAPARAASRVKEYARRGGSSVHPWRISPLGARGVEYSRNPHPASGFGG